MFQEETKGRKKVMVTKQCTCGENWMEEVDPSHPDYERAVAHKQNGTLWIEPCFDCRQRDSAGKISA